jgi:hypothetical protein
MVAPARARAATYTPMAPLAKALASPAQTAQAAAYGGPSLGQIDSRRALAMQLIGNATEGPTGGGWGALAKALTAGVGAYAYRKADQQEGVANRAMTEALKGAKTSEDALGVYGQFDPRGASKARLEQLLNPAETWSPGKIGDREGMVSSTGAFNEFDPQPYYKDPAYWEGRGQLEEADDTREHANRMAEIAAQPRPQGPETWDAPTNDPNLGWGQRSNRGQWRDLNRDPAGGQITASQIAQNAEIDAARQILKSQGYTQEKIVAAMQEESQTGMPNPDFNPTLKAIVATAIQAKVGGDPEFEQFYSGINTPAPQAAPPPPGAETQGDQGAPPSTAAESAMPLPGDVNQLQPGNVYNTAQGPAIYLGNGQFELIE